MLSLKTTGKGGSDTEAGGGGDVCNAHVGTADEQTTGMVETALVDES